MQQEKGITFQASRRDLASGHIAMLFATVLWGSLSPIAKGVLEGGVVDGLALSAIRIGGGAILFILVSLLPKSLINDKPVERKDILTLFIASAIIISLNQGLYIIGIEYTSPIDTTVMCTLTPVFTLLLAAIFIGQRLTLIKVSGVVLGLIGALIIALSDPEPGIATNPVLGDFLCIMAQVCAAAYYVFFLKIINKYPPFTIMKWLFIFSAVTYIPCMSPFLMDVAWENIDMSTVLSLLYIIIFPTFTAYLIIPFSQRVLKPTLISMYAYLQPVIAALLATFMGLAIFGFTRIIGTVMIFVGVYMVSSSGYFFKKKKITST